MRICVTCKKALPLARLLAKPDAVQCVACLEANGDEVKVTQLGRRLAYFNPDAVPSHHEQ